MKSDLQLKICLMLAVLVCSTQAANILATFWWPSHSHQMPLLRLSKALAGRGHNLTVVTANPSETPIANHTEIDISFGYEAVRNSSLGVSMQKKQKLSDMLKSAFSGIEKFAHLQLKSPAIQHFMSWAKDVKFDLILTENLLFGPYLALLHAMGPPPIVAVTTLESYFWSDESMGSPVNPSYVPIIEPYSDHMTFFERLNNLYDYIYLKCLFMSNYGRHDQLVKDIFGEGFPTLHDMERNISLLLISSYSILSFPKPTTPNIIQLGPLHILPPKPLTGDLKTWVEGAKDGVIYFSLGSIMQGTSVHEEKRNAFLAAFARFPSYRIIWKWETETHFPGQAENIMFNKWIPQQDLLAHDKVKIFMSQCGLQSVQEAIHFGVNIICIPIFGDQPRNAHKVVQLGIALELDLDYITSDAIYEALKEIIYNQRYRENIEHVSAIARDSKMSPVDEGVWWVEYVLRHKGAKLLRPATLDLHWTQYLFLDVAAFVIGLVILTSVVTIKLTKLVLKVFRKQTTIKAKTQ